MIDPLSEIISFLKPKAVFTKSISAAGAWAVRYSDFGYPSFCIVLEGFCNLAVDGQTAISLEPGDFVLLPATPGFTLSGEGSAEPVAINPHEAALEIREVRYGKKDGPASVRLLGGYFVFDSESSGLLVSLLPEQVHIRGVDRLSTLVGFLTEESTQQLPGRELVLNRLVEILMIESMRLIKDSKASSGLLHGLADARLAKAIKQMHHAPDHPWTMAELAREAALSRSAFFDIFRRTVGMPPMEYLLSWRMVLARDLLLQGLSITEVAERVGYGSANTFSNAFHRHYGQRPGSYRSSQL